MEYVWAFVLTGAIFASVDAVWLKLTASFYKKEFGLLLRSVPNFTAAIIFYLLYVLGIVVFVLEPTFSDRGWWQVAIRGAVFGMVAYATYDLTNLATLKKWSIKVTLIDLAWGSVLTGTSATLAHLILKGWLL